MTTTPSLQSTPRDRTGGVITLAGVAIGLGSLGVVPPWPPADAPTDAIRGYFAAHGDRFLLQTYLSWIAFVLFLRFFVGLARLVRERGAPEVATWSLAGATMAIATMIAGSAPWAAIAYQVPDDPGVLRALWNLGLVSAFNVVGPPLALALLAGGVGILRTGAMPRAHGVLALFAGIVNLGLGACFARGGTFSPNGPIGLAAVVSLTLFLLVGGILLLRRVPTGTP